MPTAIHDPVEFRPQPGPQEHFLASSADIAIFGGAAGGGKSWALLLEPLRHSANPKFGGVIFRRTYSQIAQVGGLWDESNAIYPHVGAKPNITERSWRFRSGATVRLSQLQYERTKHDYQGAQFAYLGFDELTHFSESQFFYMVSRMRSMSGVRPYLRATCNPDPDSWVRTFISWWIDDEGWAIPERSGKIRWFARVNDDVVWADTREALLEQHPELNPGDPLSATFILSRLKDNQALLRIDPGYEARLKSLPYVERMQLLGDVERGGNWATKPAAGLYFKREWINIVDRAPPGLAYSRAWDFAGSEPTRQNPDPDYFVSVLGGKNPNSHTWITNATWMRLTPGRALARFIAIVHADGRTVTQLIPQDPGSAGKTLVSTILEHPDLAGYPIRPVPTTGDKIVRFTSASVAAEQGRMHMVRGLWNERWLRELEAFPEGKHDDLVDATADLINHGPRPSGFGVKGSTA